MANEHFISGDGIRELSYELNGNENVVMGTRPFGFHAGNMASLVVYPLLLANSIVQQGITPRFHFHCWFNDLEQHATVGHDGKPASADLVNVYPAERTLQFTPGPAGFKGSIVDYWQPLIENSVKLIERNYPSTQITFHRTSEMKTTEPFAKTVVGALTSADLVADTIEGALGMEVRRPAEFVRAVCPECKFPVPNTKVLKKDELAFRNSRIEITCPRDSRKATGSVAEFDWWVQFRLLTIPRGQLGQKADLRMMGADHLEENRTNLASKLTKIFKMRPVESKFLYAPLLLSYDGKKMGKSNNNVVYASPNDLLLLLAGERGTEIETTGMPSLSNIKMLASLFPSHMAQPTPNEIMDMRDEYLSQVFRGAITGTWPPGRGRVQSIFGRRAAVGWGNPHA